jgi:HEAT repeat protein
VGNGQKLILLGLVFVAGLGAAWAVSMLGVDLPGTSARPPGEGSAARDAEGDLSAGDSPWDEDEDDQMFAVAPADPLDPLGAFRADPSEGDSSGNAGSRERGRRGGGGATGSEAARRGGADGPIPGAPNPGGKHVAALEEVIASGDPEKLRLFLVSTMSARGTELGEAEAALLLGAMGETKNFGLRSAMLMHLERIGGDGITVGLVDFLRENPNTAIAARTLASLGRIDSPPAVAALVDVLASPDFGRNRRAAAEALARMRDPMAIAPLAATLNAADRATRQLAAATLSRIGTQAGYAAVLDLARTGDAADRALGRRLLEKSSRGTDAVAVLGPALARESDATLRVSLARTLGRARSAGASDYLIQAARSDRKPQVRAEALTSLARLGDRSAYADIEMIARDDPHPAVQKAARRALKKLAK